MEKKATDLDLEQFHEEMKQLMKDTAKVLGIKINDAEPKPAKLAKSLDAELRPAKPTKSLEEEMDECIRKASLEFEAYLDSLEA